MIVISFSLLFACRSAKVQLDEDTSVEEPEWWESDVEETDESDGSSSSDSEEDEKEEDTGDKPEDEEFEDEKDSGLGDTQDCGDDFDPLHRAKAIGQPLSVCTMDCIGGVKVVFGSMKRIKLSVVWTVLMRCTEQQPEPLSEDECVPRELAPAMPNTARGYAELCSRLLGEVPTADCGEGVRIPITVDRTEVYGTVRRTVRQHWIQRYL